MMETPKNFQPFTIDKEEDPKRIRSLTIEEREDLGLEEKKGQKEVFSPVLRASWKNPETQNEREIEIDFEKNLAEQKAFYKDRLNLEINEAAAREIWKENYAEIRSEIEKYGYDKITIIPDNLPEEAELNKKLIETMDEGPDKGKVAATYQGDNFKNSGSFAGVRNSEQPKYRIVLTHSEQNICNNPAANPYLKATLDKNIMELSGLDQPETEKRIGGGQEIKINFNAIINGQEIRIQSDGGSLEEYIVQQSMYFEKNKKHLDENGWMWLPKSFSGSRVVLVSWGPDGRRLGVDADAASGRNGNLGIRLSRSFS